MDRPHVHTLPVDDLDDVDPVSFPCTSQSPPGRGCQEGDFPTTGGSDRDCGSRAWVPTEDLRVVLWDLLRSRPLVLLDTVLFGPESRSRPRSFPPRTACHLPWALSQDITRTSNLGSVSPFR